MSHTGMCNYKMIQQSCQVLAMLIFLLTASRYYQRYSWNNIWASNYEPTFTCPMERKIGSRGDGGKWTCDPHRIPRKLCLSYKLSAFTSF